MEQEKLKEAEANSKNAWDIWGIWSVWNNWGIWNKAWEELEVTEAREITTFIEREKADAESPCSQKAEKEGGR